VLGASDIHGKGKYMNQYAKRLALASLFVVARRQQGIILHTKYAIKFEKRHL
jgi:hypothetical protein